MRQENAIQQKKNNVEVNKRLERIIKDLRTESIGQEKKKRKENENRQNDRHLFCIILFSSSLATHYISLRAFVRAISSTNRNHTYLLVQLYLCIFAYFICRCVLCSLQLYRYTAYVAINFIILVFISLSLNLLYTPVHIRW